MSNGKDPHTTTGLQCEGWHRRVGGKDRYLMFDAVPVCNDKDMKNAEEQSRKKSSSKHSKPAQPSPQAGTA